MYDYFVYGALLVQKYHVIVETLLVIVVCGLATLDIILARMLMEQRRKREAKTLAKLKKFRSTKLGRAYRKAKDEERKMKRRVTDRLRRAKKREATEKKRDLRLAA